MTKRADAMFNHGGLFNFSALVSLLQVSNDETETQLPRSPPVFLGSIGPASSLRPDVATILPLDGVSLNVTEFTHRR
jgi:hypothetical protein